MASSPTSDRAAHRVQKEYLGEISALADVLFRTKDAAARTVEDHVAPLSDPVQFPQVIIDDCMKDLDSLRLELVTPWQGVFGPIGEVALRKHMEELVPLRGLFSEFLSVAETLTVLPAMHRKVENLNLEQNSDVVLSAQTVVLVIDGPDEMESPPVLKSILASFIKSNCRMMVTSREIPEIRAALSLASIQEVFSVPGDLRTHLYPGTGVGQPNLGAYNSQGNAKSSEIIFNSSRPPLKRRWKESRHSQSLGSALAHRVLSWVASTERPLLASELIHGLAVDQKAKPIDDEDMVSGVEPHDHDQRSSLLHLAALRKDTGFAEALSQCGADMDAKHVHNMTPLQHALADGFEETVTVLVANGADVNRREEKIPCLIDAARCSPLVLALGRKCEEEEKVRLVRMLLEHGADVNIGMRRTPNVKSAEFFHRGFGGHLGFDTAGMTAMHYAAQTRNPDVIRLLIGAGANPKALDEFGRTVVHHLAYAYSKPTNKEAEDNRTESRGLESTSDALLLLLQKCGMEYLDFAVSVADCRMAEALAGLDARLQTNIPLNPMLLEAVNELEAGMVELLLQHAIIRHVHASGLDPNKEISGRLLHCLATLMCHTPQAAQAAQVLLDVGADPYKPNERGIDAFLITALSCKEAALKILLNQARAHPDETHWTHRLPPQEGSTPEEYSPQVQQICEALNAAGLINKKYTTDRAYDTEFDRGTLLYEATGGKHELHRSGAIPPWSTFCCTLDDADANILDSENRSPLHLAYPQAALGRTQSLPREFDNDRPSGLWVGERWRATPLYVAAMKGNTDVVRLIVGTVQQSTDVDIGVLVRLRTDDGSTGRQARGAGPTALHMVLDTGVFYGLCAEPLSGARMEIARMLMDHGADVAGVADHL
ncbi:hypothetical protein PgNI_06501 [Pyricularia grisea]|uniref:Uncharacterized protein n=1 Tax=Pyricularia grisea TaxID=148305 RepID=A0A6P8B7Q4_PYRGI|nr:hypothetical protein PgNI_06501 [Pyricularia grisea]TLD11357.1 hypothetical protein PgNI_06501 [Pyricularia grisea]